MSRPVDLARAGKEPMEFIRQLLTRLGVMAAHPGAFAVLILYALLWFIFDRSTMNWHAVTTLIVWFMTLLIQRAELTRRGNEKAPGNSVNVKGCDHRVLNRGTSPGNMGRVSLSDKMAYGRNDVSITIWFRKKSPTLRHVGVAKIKMP